MHVALVRAEVKNRRCVNYQSVSVTTTRAGND